MGGQEKGGQRLITTDDAKFIPKEILRNTRPQTPAVGTPRGPGGGTP